MKTNFRLYRSIFINLLREEFMILGKTFYNKVINSLIWATTTILVAAYLLPLFGMDQSFGSFLAIGTFVSIGGFEMYSSVGNFVADLQGEKYFNFQLTLPIPTWLLLTKNITVYTINSIAISLIAFICCKLVLFNTFNLSQIDILKSIICFLVINLFYGVFTIWGIAITKNLLEMENVFMRYIYPLWYLGGYQFTWKALYALFPTLAYINLINPYTYIYEGMRSAMLEADAYLNFWICIGALLLATFILGWSGITKLKKRLDFV